MGYAQGDTILDDEYNTFATGNAAGSGDNSVANLNTLWGVGTGDKGYGESSTISAVSAGATITASQWNTLLGRIETIGAHQATTVTNYSTLSSSDTITFLSTVSTDITNCTNKRLNATAVASDITTNGAVAGSGSWTTNSVSTMTVTFASANALRYYFNAGGQILITCSRSGGTSHTKNTEWADHCSDFGTLILSGSTSHTVNSVALIGVTGVGNTAGGGGTTYGTIDAHDLTTSDQQLVKFYQDTSPYTGNYIQVQAKTATSATQIVLTTTFQDDAADNVDDTVDGTLTCTHTLRPPDDTYLTSASWGTPTMSGSMAQS